MRATRIAALGVGALAAVALAGPATAQPAPATPPAQTLAYGADALQALDFWPAKAADGTPLPAGARSPLILFVHGGGWTRGTKENALGRWKPQHFPAEGYALASIGYRLVPQARVEDEAADVALSLRKLIDRADALGIDRHHIVLMGHSAGAQLVALVGTDERYLKAAGLSFADVAGVIAIDGAAYDVPAQLRIGAPMMHDRYVEAFGSDPARQAALSPTMQAVAPNATEFLLLHVQRPDGIAQADALAAALRSGGSAVEIGSFPGSGLIGHMEINRRLGDPTYPATAAVDIWLKRLFAH